MVRGGGASAVTLRVVAVLCCMAVLLAGCRAFHHRGHGVRGVPSPHKAREVGRPAPWPVLRKVAGVDPYLAQRRRVERLLRDDQLIGFKAGLTGPGAPARFALAEPVFGVLPGRSRIRAVAEGHFLVPAQRYWRAMIEIELALILGHDVERPFSSVAEFRAAVSSVAPAVEVPDLGFESSDFSGHDLIASNIALRHFFIGTPHTLRDVDIDGLRAVLRRDGRELTVGFGSAAMHSQWRAGMWLANRALAAGWPLRRGQLLLTGSLGQLVPATPGGFYTADFGTLGVLRFELRDQRQKPARLRQGRGLHGVRRPERRAGGVRGRP